MHIEIFATLEANWSIQKNKKKKKLRNAFVKFSSWDKSKITDWEWANYGINHLGNYTFSFPFSKGLSFLVATKPWGMVNIMLIKSVILEPSAVPDRGERKQLHWDLHSCLECWDRSRGGLGGLVTPPNTDLKNIETHAYSSVFFCNYPLKHFITFLTPSPWNSPPFSRHLSKSTFTKSWIHPWNVSMKSDLQQIIYIFVQ